MKPNVRPEQTTLILRDIPRDTPVDKILEIFASTGSQPNGIMCPPIVSVRPDMNDTWSVPNLFHDIPHTIYIIPIF